MTAVVAVVLTVLALVDGTLSGFRASLGRTGLVRHRPEDRSGARAGLLTSLAVLTPVAVLCVVVAATRGTADLTRAGTSMLWIYLPYGALVTLALFAYGLLHWQVRYLASAVILGPFTLARPPVVVAGGVLAVVRAADAVTVVAVVLSVVGVLAVEPLCNVRYRSTVVRT